MWVIMEAWLQVPGVEADDVIGTMARRGMRAGMEVQIASPDKVGLHPQVRHRLFSWRGSCRAISCRVQERVPGAMP